jgi:predicted nucleic acid-binding protein
MRLVVDTSTVIAVVAGEAEKARLIELTKDATIAAPPSIDWEVGNAFSAMLKRSRINLSFPLHHSSLLSPHLQREGVRG